MSTANEILDFFPRQEIDNIRETARALGNNVTTCIDTETFEFADTSRLSFKSNRVINGTWS